MNRKGIILLLSVLVLGYGVLYAADEPGAGGMFNVSTEVDAVAKEVEAVSAEIDKLANSDEPAEQKVEKVIEIVGYSVKAGDSLWKISERLLGDGNRYREIVEANKDAYPSLLKNPDLIYAGWDLKVPVEKESPATPPTTETPAGTDAPAVVEPGNATPAAETATLPQWSIKERIAKLQNALDSANRALLAQGKRIADLNAGTIRFMIDNKFMTEEEWMAMNPPEGYFYRLDRLGRVELVGSNNAPLTNEEIAKMDSEAATANKGEDEVDDRAWWQRWLDVLRGIGKDQNASKPAADSTSTATGTSTDTSAATSTSTSTSTSTGTDTSNADRYLPNTTDTSISASTGTSTSTSTSTNTGTDTATDASLEKTANAQYQKFLGEIKMPELDMKSSEYYKMVHDGVKLVNTGKIFKTSPFDFLYQTQSLVDLQKTLINSQLHFEKMIEKDRTNIFLGLVGQNIQSAGRRVEQDKARLKKAWEKMQVALEATKTETTKLKGEAEANRKKAKEANDALAKLDVYDSANYKEVSRLKSELKDLDKDHDKLKTNIEKLEKISKSFS